MDVEKLLRDRVALELVQRGEVDPVRADELPDAIGPDDGGFVRTLPGLLADAGGLDGFFVARLRAPTN